MKSILKADSQPLDKASAVALGMFDGVHLGHRQVINAALDYARKHNLYSACITLANHPRELTKGQAPKLLTDLETRLSIFEELGLDYVLVLDFNEELMNTEAQDFLEKYLVDILRVNFISTGYDHHFGKNRSGTPAMLEKWCQSNSVGLEIIEPVKVNGQVVSSSLIRGMIEQGDLDAAQKILSHKFRLIGKVIHGDKRGRELGFPTANLEIDPHVIIPKAGVYSGTCRVSNQDTNYKCAINIGTRPSFTSSQQIGIEAHIINFTGDIYDQKLIVDFESRIRDEKSFNSPQELKEQIRRDVLTCS